MLYTKIKKLVRTQFPDAQFILFGSAGSQLAIRGSDIDVLVHAPESHIKNLYHTVSRLLLGAEWTIYVEKVVSSVPILKIKDDETNLQADICFNREDGYKGVICALSMQISFPELRPMYFILKVFLKERANLDQTRDGGICSFMLLNMITFYLQTHYKESLNKFTISQTQIQGWSQQSSKEDKERDMAAQTDLELHKHLLKFFKFYGEELDQHTNFISIRKGGFLHQRDLSMEAEFQSERARGP